MFEPSVNRGAPDPRYGATDRRGRQWQVGDRLVGPDNREARILRFTPAGVKVRFADGAHGRISLDNAEACI